MTVMRFLLEPEPGAAKEKCSLLFPPELDIVLQAFVAVLVSQSS